MGINREWLYGANYVYEIFGDDFLADYINKLNKSQE